MFKEINSYITLIKQYYLKSTHLHHQADVGTIKHKSLDVIKTGLAVLFLIVSLNHGSAHAIPCSCWDGGGPLGSGVSCWAAWDTGMFAPGFDPKQLDNVSKELWKVQGSISSKIITLFIGKEEIPGISHSSIWDKAASGIEAMELCHEACDEVNGFYNLQKTVFWNAEPRHLQNCRSTHPEVVNKYLPAELIRRKLGK